MSVWAISDPHLSFGVVGKDMGVFGPLWEGYTDKIRENWLSLISEKDLVLIPGDISWAKRLSEAMPDLEWLHSLPGTKVLLKGNHDYWWTSLNKVMEALPSSLHIIQNNVFKWNNVSIGGSRLWDTDQYSFNSIINFKNEGPLPLNKEAKEEQRRIFLREMERLEISLKSLDQGALFRIALTHYPPIGLELQESEVSIVLEKYNVNICVFGHLHNVKEECKNLMGERNNIQYILSSCDYCHFKPLKILDKDQLCP